MSVCSFETTLFYKLPTSYRHVDYIQNKHLEMPFRKDIYHISHSVIRNPYIRSHKITNPREFNLAILISLFWPQHFD